jgi:UDP-N-acetylglucosamine 1-carboxyvinyltransferase
MDKLLIEGGARLEGEIRTSGSKNAALPILAACVLTDEPITLHRIPRVRDIRTMEKLMTHVGVSMTKDADGPHRIQCANLAEPTAPYDLVKTMRASSLVLGPLVARCGRARVSMPGGCAIGARPINLHVAALEQLGATIHQEHGYIEAQAPNGLKGGLINFDRITVTGTEDVLMAATLAEGETVIENAAREPEVVDLAEMLTKMGAQIEGAGTSTIRVRGVSKLHGVEHEIIADRIEAGTYMIAAAITGGDVLITACMPEHLGALVSKMRQAGVDLTEEGPTGLRVRSNGKLRSTDITTEEYPGFATDLQAQYMGLMTKANGISFITETIFENRFMHVRSWFGWARIFGSKAGRPSWQAIVS